MKKNKNSGYLILGILFVLFNVIAFAIPTVKTGTFWTAYVFTVVAFAAQVGVWKIAFGKEDALKSKFLGIPVVHVGTVYLVIQMIAFAVFMTVPTFPAWSAIVACAVILVAFVVCLISADVGRSEIDRVEAKVKAKTFYIKSLQADVELLADAEADTDVKGALQQLAEKIRFSDPMSCEELEVLEAQISDKVAELKTADQKLPIINELKSLLVERNKKCKILK